MAASFVLPLFYKHRLALVSLKLQEFSVVKTQSTIRADDQSSRIDGKIEGIDMACIVEVEDH